jgi:hypothetical protein
MPDRTDDAPRRPPRPLSRPFRTPLTGEVVPAARAPETPRRPVSGPLRAPFVPTPARAAATRPEVPAVPPVMPEALENDRASAGGSAAEVEQRGREVHAPIAGRVADGEPTDVIATEHTSAEATAAETTLEHSAALATTFDEWLRSTSAEAPPNEAVEESPAVAAETTQEVDLATAAPIATSGAATQEIPEATAEGRSPSAEAWPEDVWHEDETASDAEGGDLWRAGGPELDSAFGSGGVGAQPRPESHPDASRQSTPSVLEPTEAAPAADVTPLDAAGLSRALEAVNSPSAEAEWSRLTAAAGTGTPPMPLAEALELLASRIRSGSLEVSGYEPGMSDAAALTAALAAVLGVKR